MFNLFRKYKIKGIYLFAFIIIFLVILMALFPGIFTRIDPNKIVGDSLISPSKKYIFGTDDIGRDIFSRIIHGTRNTLYVGLGSSILSALFGIPLGLISGYFGGKTDLIIMRILDALMSFPAILFAVLIIAVTGANASSLVFAIAVINFPRFARIVRSSTLYVKKMDFVLATKTFGAKTHYLIFNTILRNCLSPIVVQFTLLVATAILIEAGMSFIGLGIQPPNPAWGSMLYVSQLYIRKAWWYAFIPGFMIFIVVYSFNLFGDWLRDFSDPKKRTS
ncbi:MAG: ABC transporter permease [Actinobacteria bacterium]|nr:ABC transporter permease [Actinomycetota bacterium]